MPEQPTIADEIIRYVQTGGADLFADFLVNEVAHVMEWYELRRPELAAAWELAKARRPLQRIEPLE